MKKAPLFLVATTLLLPSASLYAGTIVFQENFETATQGLSVTTAGQFYTIGGTNVDVIGGNLYGGYCSGPESGNCVDLGGTQTGSPNGNAYGHLQTGVSLA